VALLVSCLVDLFRPSVAFASVQLLERAGCRVVVPRDQTCCGQPAYNSGDRAGAARLARQTIRVLEAADYTVVPSGSCAGMLVHHYPRLLSGRWQVRAQKLAEKTWELSSFLHDVLHYRPPQAERPPLSGGHTAAYHDACAGLRELGIREQPRALLRSVHGLELKELEQRDVCCGFGGTFCAKMPEISAHMADQKLADATATGASMLVAGDLCCLLSLAGRAARTGVDLEFRHVAELLAGTADTTPGIGRSEAV
jgi:L-lactate dehydrogenase complex protein LldE